jgi:hypothetical protein
VSLFDDEIKPNTDRSTDDGATSNVGTVTAAHLRDLMPDPQNRRAHNPRNVGMIVDALHHVGIGRSIVIDEDNVLLCGMRRSMLPPKPASNTFASSKPAAMN